MNSPMKAGITNLLDGAPQTAAELADRHGWPVAFVRGTLASMVFDDRAVTCDAAGRFALGAPDQLLRAG